MSSKETFDRSQFAANFAGIEDLAVRAARSFLELSESSVVAIRNSIERTDRKELELSAHTLKGAISTFHAANSANLANQLESLGKYEGMTENSVLEAQRLLRELETELGFLRAELRSYIQELSA